MSGTDHDLLDRCYQLVVGYYCRHGRTGVEVKVQMPCNEAEKEYRLSGFFKFHSTFSSNLSKIANLLLNPNRHKAYLGPYFLFIRSAVSLSGGNGTLVPLDYIFYSEIEGICSFILQTPSQTQINQLCSDSTFKNTLKKGL